MEPFRAAGASYVVEGNVTCTNQAFNLAALVRDVDDGPPVIQVYSVVSIAHQRAPDASGPDVAESSAAGAARGRPVARRQADVIVQPPQPPRNVVLDTSFLLSAADKVLATGRTLEDLFSVILEEPVKGQILLVIPVTVRLELDWQKNQGDRKSRWAREVVRWVARKLSRRVTVFFCKLSAGYRASKQDVDLQSFVKRVCRMGPSEQEADPKALAAYAWK